MTLLAKRRSAPVIACVLGTSLLVACGGGGGGGGGHKFTGGLEDPVVPLKGTGGTYSMTPAEANAANGDPTRAPPPFPAAVVKNQNQFLRFEFPFAVDATSILTHDPALAPFDYLNGNMTIVDENGDHVHGIVAVNGIDVTGRDLSKDVGWPEDRTASGRDQNLGANVVVFIARGLRGPDKRVDSDLASIAAFRGWDGDNDASIATTDMKKVRVRCNEVNGQRINGYWVISVGDADTEAPLVEQIIPTKPVPGQPELDGKSSAEPDSSFIITFNEPVVPQSVGLSAKFNTNAFDGNLPQFTWPNPPQPPLPNTSVSAPTTAATPIFIPFDMNPIGSNNLATYVLRPLLTLPSKAEVRVIVWDVNTNTKAAIDLHGNAFSRGKNFVKSVNTGAGPAIVNAPVSPQAVYWIPAGERGMGCIDLDGFGFTTNKPNAHGDVSKGQFDQREDQLGFTSIITRRGRPLEAGAYPGYDAVKGRARDGTNNFYSYPVGTGSRGLQYQTRKQDPGTPGNPGTAIPGINEKSDGLDTFVKDSNGSVNLTGGANGLVGNVSDCEIGDALDRVFFDTLNFWAQTSSARFSIDAYTVGLTFLDKNSVGEPPVPNPPPLRYNLGLQPIAFVIDNSNPSDPLGFVIEGEEVFGGLGNPGGNPGSPYSHLMLIPSQIDPKFGPDTPPPPYYDNGPPGQSATQGQVWATRQQIGNFLYVCDQTNNQLRVVNSNTFRVITSIDLPDPWGVGIMPHLKQLYVSNFGDDSISVIGTDPIAPGFHQETVRIPVGHGPRAVSCQPDGEDVLVANWVGSTLDIINPGLNTVRKTITALMNQPFDIVVTERQSAAYEGFGSAIYFAYISNFGSNTVVVFESGPDGPFGIGLDNIRGEVPTDAGQDDIKLIEPRGMTYDFGVNREGVSAGGVYVTHRDENGRGVVSRIQFTHQPQFGPIIINPPPGFFQPPGFSDRRFEVVSQWGTSAQGLLSGTSPTDVALSDLNVGGYKRLPAGGANLASLTGTPGLYSGVVSSKHFWRVVPAPGTTYYPPGPWRAVYPDQLYISYSDTGVIDVVDPDQGNVILKQITGNGTPVQALVHYWNQ